MFHISLPCQQLEKTEEFYLSIPGAKLGRKQQNWIDIDFFGNQVTFIEVDSDFKFSTYQFETSAIPSFHFGIVVKEKRVWNKLFKELGTRYHVEIVGFLEGNTGEHHSFFIKDPNGYTIEFKYFTAPNQVFSSN